METDAIAWCATCGEASAKTRVNSWLTGRRFRCPKSTLDDFHVAAVMDARLLYWLRLQAWIARLNNSSKHPRAFLCKKRAERYVPLLAVVLLAAYWLVAYISRPVGVFLALAVLLDALLFNTMVAFVTQHPRMPMRTVMFAVGTFFEIAAAFGVIYLALPSKSFNPDIQNAFNAFYFSVMTLTTVGYGDFHPATDAIAAKLFAITEVGVGLYFLAGLFTIMTSWASSLPLVPSLEDLIAELKKRGGE